MSKYGEWKKNYLREYGTKVLKRFSISFRKEYYESCLEPLIKASGVPLATYAKRAMFEKLSHDIPDCKLLCYVRTKENDIIATYKDGTVRWIQTEPTLNPESLISGMALSIDDSKWDYAETDDLSEFFSSAEILAEAVTLN